MAATKRVSALMIMLTFGLVATASAQTITFNYFDAEVGAGLQTGYIDARLSDDQHGGITVRITSPDTNLVRVTADENTPGGEFVDVFVPQGSTDARFFIQAMEGVTGTVPITATAPGYADGVQSIDVVVPALRLSGLTTTQSPFDPLDVFTVQVGIPNGTNTNFSATQKVRVGGPGLTATVSVTDPVVALLETDAHTAQVVSVAIAPGEYGSAGTVAGGGVAFDALAVGAVDVDATIPGFTPISSVPQTVTVTAAEITFLHLPSDLGAGLQEGDKRARLSGSAHGGRTIHLESGDPSKLLLAPDASTAGSPTLDVFVADGSIDAPFYVQAIEGTSGTVTVTASTPDFNSAATWVVVQIAFYGITGLSSSIDTLDPSDPFYVTVGLPNSGFTSISKVQRARIGGPGLNATIVSSDGVVGLLETASTLDDSATVFIPPGDYRSPTSVATGGVGFDGVGVGMTQVTASIPDLLPVSTAVVEVTVTQPSIFYTYFTSTLGSGLRSRKAYANLGASLHGGVVVRVESLDPDLALISDDENLVGSTFVDIAVADGATRAGFWIHAPEDTVGTVQIMSTSPLFQSHSAPVEVVQPAVRINSLADSQDTIDPPDPFTISIGPPNYSFTSISTQEVRPGSSGFVIDVSVDDPAVAELQTQGGNGPAVTVTIPAGSATSSSTYAAGGVQFEGLSAGTAIVEASSPHVGQITTSFRTVNVTAPTINSVNAVGKLGWGLQDGGTAYLSAGGHGGVTVHVESSDPSVMLISDAPSAVGQAFADIFLADGTTTASFWTQAIDGQTGMVDVTVTAPGFVSNLDSVEVVQPGVELTGLVATQDVADAPDKFYARVGVPQTDNSAVHSSYRQDRRAGMPPLEVTLISSDGAVAEILNGGASDDSAFVYIAPENSSSPTGGGLTGSELDGLSYGQTLVTASIPGFIQTGDAQRVVDVSNLNIVLNGLADRIGAGLQSEAVSAELGEGGHGGLNVEVTVADSNLARVSANALVVGSGTVNIPLANGETEAVFYVQALDASAGSTVTVTAHATGFSDGVRTVDLVPAGTSIILLAGTMDVNADDDEFIVQVGAITPDTTGIGVPQALRGGGPSRTVAVWSSDPLLGLVATAGGAADTAYVTLDPGEQQTASTVATGGLAFDPVGPGQVEVTAAIPGFEISDDGMLLVTLTGEVTAVGDLPVAVFRLDQNAPNPFNPVTRIGFSLEKAGPVELAVYDVTGARVATLLREHRPAGPFVVDWDGRDERGSSVGSGVYLYRLVAGPRVETRKMTLLK